MQISPVHGITNEFFSVKNVFLDKLNVCTANSHWTIFSMQT